MARIRKKAVIEQGMLFSAPDMQEPLTAGTDEAGRGCLAGPVVAGAVIGLRYLKNERRKAKEAIRDIEEYTRED